MIFLVTHIHLHVQNDNEKAEPFECIVSHDTNVGGSTSERETQCVFHAWST